MASSFSRTTLPQAPAFRVPVRAPLITLPNKKADALVWTIAVTLLAQVWRIQSIFPPLAKIKLIWIATALGLVFLLVNRDPLRRVALIKNERISRLLLLLLGLMVAGVPFALVQGEAVHGLWGVVLPNLALFTLVACSVRSTRDIEVYALVSLCGATVYAFMRVRGMEAGFDYYDRNDLALLLVCHISFAIYFLRPGVSIARRIFALGSLGLMVYVIVAGGSRGGFVGLMAIGLYVLLRYRGIPLRTRIFALVGGFLLLSLVANESYWERMRSLLNPKSDYNWSGNSDSGRMDVWGRGIGYMIRNPVLGVGLRNFPSAEGNSSLSATLQSRDKGFKWSVAHSSFVGIGAELGIIGFISFLAIFVSGIRSMARVRMGSPPGVAPQLEFPQSQMLLGSLLGFVVCGLFLSAEHFAVLYVLLGMVVGLLKLLSVGGRRVMAAGTPTFRPAPTSARKASRLRTN